MTDAWAHFPPEEDFLEAVNLSKFRPSSTMRYQLELSGIDLRRDLQTLPIRFQLPCNACSSFGIAALIEHWLLERTGFAPELAAGWMHSCIAEADCKRGVSLSYLADRLPGMLIPRADQNAYPWPATACTVIGDVRCPEFLSFSGDHAMKTMLQNGCPVATGMRIDERFRHLTGTVPYTLGNTPEYAREHVIVLVGFDPSTNCWIVRNSLGNQWGDLGHFYVPFGQCEIGRYPAYCVLPALA